MTDATVTFDLLTALGVPFDATRTKVWLTFNTDEGWIVDATGAVRMDAGTATITSAGLVTITGIPVPSGSTNPTDFQVKVHFDAPVVLPGVRSLKRKTGDFGWMTVTADADLTDLIAEQYVPPTWLTTAQALLQGYVDEGADLLAAQIALSEIGTSDSLVSALILGTAGAGPLTRSALSTSFAPIWKASTAYTAGQAVTAPDGSVIARNADGTSRPTFDTTEKASWTAIITKAGTLAQIALAAAYAAKNNGQMTGNTQAERLGIGVAPSIHNPVYVQTVMKAPDINYPGGAGDNIFQQFNNIVQGDHTVRATVTVTATGGTWAATMGGSSVNIAAGATAAAVQTALRGLPSVGAGNFGHSYIDVTGADGGPYVISYTTRFLTDSTWNAKQLTVDGSSLTGSGHNIAIAWENLGGADTGWLWGANDYNVSSVSVSGLGRWYGRLTEIAMTVPTDAGQVVAGHDSVSWTGAGASGTVNQIVGRRISVGRHNFGTLPYNGKADELYGLYVNGIVPSRVVTDAVTTNTSAVVTSAALGRFTAWDAGKVVTGTNIPVNTYILSVDSATQVTLSNPCTGSGTVSMTIAGLAQESVAYAIFVEAGRSMFNGQVRIQSTAINEPGLQVTAQSGITSGTLTEWLVGSTSVARIDALGYFAGKHDVVAREGDASNRQVTIGGLTATGTVGGNVVRPGIKFGPTPWAQMYAEPNVLSMAAANAFRLACVTDYSGGARPSAATVKKGSALYDDNLTVPKPIFSDGTSWQETALALPAGSAALDFPSIAAGGQQELTLTVAGAVAGDTVLLGPPSTIEAGLVWNAYVSAADTVKVRVSNITGSAIDPNSGTWKARIVR